MRATPVRVHVALGLQAAALVATVSTAGCGSLWRPFLDPQADDAGVDLASAPPPQDLSSASTLTDLSGPTSGQAWLSQSSGTTQALYGVWGASVVTIAPIPTDGGTTVTSTQTQVFAAGAAATVTHLADANSGKWAATTLVNGTAAPPTLYGITGRSFTDVTAIGDGQVQATWKGSVWTIGAASAQLPFLGVASALDQTSYLAVGKSDTINILASPARAVPVGYTPTQADLTSAFNIANVIWIGTSSGNFVRYDSAGFSSVGAASGKAIRSVWANGSADVWAAGDAGTVMHYDGSSWSAVTVPLPTTPIGWHGVSGDGGHNVWIVGDLGFVLRFNGTQWTLWQYAAKTTLHGVWAGSASLGAGVWAVGEQGLILHQ